MLARLARPRAVILSVAVTTCVAVLGCLASGVRSSQDLVLLRNAAIAELAPAALLEWTPEAVPKDYLVETRQAPERLQRFAAEASVGASAGDDFSSAIRLANALVSRKKRDGEPIQSNTLTAFERITTEGAGYCADYTQVFNALGIAAGVAVREWGMSFRGYGGDGHAFSEVWDRGRRKWLFIDSYYSFYVTDRAGEPLSATELRESLAAGDGGELVVVPINREKFGFKSAEQAIAYYRRGAPRFYMVWGNNVFSYDENMAVKLFSPLSRSAEQLAGIVTGAQPKLLIPGDAADGVGMAEIRKLRILLAMFALSFVVACGALLPLWGTRS